MGKGGKVKYDTSPYDNYQKYLNNYDTSKVDGTISNMEQTALNLSKMLGNIGNYAFNVDGSDTARQRAEMASYQSSVDKLQPQFKQQTSDLATALANKGLAVGSEAYQRAMNDLQDNQNEALNQAAYQSTLAGQSAFSNSLADQMNAGSYGQQAQGNFVNLLNALMANSVSGYENQQNLFSVGTAKSDLKYQQDKANKKGGLMGALNGALAGAAAGSALGPWGMVAGAGLGGFSGYN